MVKKSFEDDGYLTPIGVAETVDYEGGASNEGVDTVVDTLLEMRLKQTLNSGNDSVKAYFETAHLFLSHLKIQSCRKVFVEILSNPRSDEFLLASICFYLLQASASDEFAKKMIQMIFTEGKSHMTPIKKNIIVLLGHIIKSWKNHPLTAELKIMFVELCELSRYEVMEALHIALDSDLGLGFVKEVAEMGKLRIEYMIWVCQKCNEINRDDMVYLMKSLGDEEFRITVGILIDKASKSGDDFQIMLVEVFLDLIDHYSSGDIENQSEFRINLLVQILIASKNF